MAIIPEFMLNAVVALGEEDERGNEYWIGTGFIVAKKAKDDPTRCKCFIITNRHVVEGRAQLLVRVNSCGASFIKNYPLDLMNENGARKYSVHPDKEADVVAIQIVPNVLAGDEAIWDAIDIDDHALTLAQMEETGVAEGCLVYALGFPMSMVDDIKTPICRLGCISRISDAFIRADENPNYLVDAQVFPGNSGGPIISRPEAASIKGTPFNSRANLIGILSGYIPYHDDLISAQTGMPMMVREENSGLTVVHPVDRIKEVVELEWERCVQEYGEAIE